MAPHPERRSTFPRGVALALLVLVGCAGPEPALPKGSRIQDLVPRELMAKANRGRQVVNPEGFFRFPSGVRRVWIDVGAHHLETTRAELRYPDVAIVAIEPLALGRVERVRAEIINTPESKRLHGQGMASEGEIVSYLEGRGFRLEAEIRGSARSSLAGSALLEHPAVVGRPALARLPFRRARSLSGYSAVPCSTLKPRRASKPPGLGGHQGIDPNVLVAAVKRWRG